MGGGETGGETLDMLLWCLTVVAFGPTLVVVALSALKLAGIDLSPNKPLFWTWIVFRAVPSLLIAFGLFVALPIYVTVSLLQIALTEPERVPWGAMFQDALPLIGLVLLPIALLGAVLLLNRIAYWGQPDVVDRPLLPENPSPWIRWAIVCLGALFIVGEGWLLIQLAASLS